jgi:hypothetical protein
MRRPNVALTCNHFSDLKNKHMLFGPFRCALNWEEVPVRLRRKGALKTDSGQIIHPHCGNRVCMPFVCEPLCRKSCASKSCNDPFSLVKYHSYGLVKKLPHAKLIHTGFDRPGGFNGM